MTDNTIPPEITGLLTENLKFAIELSKILWDELKKKRKKKT